MTTEELQVPVTNISEFKKKYGEVGWQLTIAAFIERAPWFPGDRKLAGEIGIMVADLSSALKEVPIR
jgi:hypothetical protein